MATYTDPSTIGTNPDEPVTSEFGTASIENPVAIAEGASGAPVVRAGWHPYDLTEVGGTEDGVIYDFSVDGTVSVLDSPDFEDGYEYGFFFRNISGVATLTASVQLEREDDGTYSTATTVGISAAGSELTGMVYAQVPRIGAVDKTLVLTEVSVGSAGFDTPAIYAHLGVSPSFKMLSARFTFDVAIDRGQIIMLRRREFIK